MFLPYSPVPSVDDSFGSEVRVLVTAELSWGEQGNIYRKTNKQKIDKQTNKQARK